MRAFVAALLIAGAPVFALAQQPPASPPQTAPPATPAASTEPSQQPAEPGVLPVPPERRVSGFVIDARGVLAKFGQRPVTAEFLRVESADMPGPGLGGAIGAHVYPLRLGRVALGIGGEVLLARRSREKLNSRGEPTGLVLRSRLFTFSPQVSLNFGRRSGWSYVSAGFGKASFETWNEAAATVPDRRVNAINYGGGARWFTVSHLAFTVDLRFYAVAAAPEIVRPRVIERPKQRLVVISAGLSLR